MGECDAIGKAYADLQSALFECASVFGPAFEAALKQQGAIIYETMAAYYATPSGCGPIGETDT